MPLYPGKNSKTISNNIKQLISDGYPQQQAVAIAYSVARKGKKNMAKKRKRKSQKHVKAAKKGWRKRKAKLAKRRRK